MLRAPDRGNLALFLDIDGTLVDLAARPEDVAVPAGLVDLLQSLEATLDGALALVSGRAIADLDGLFHPLRLRTAGVHGAETRIEPGGTIHRIAADELPASLLSELEDLIRAFPGVTIENKRHAFAVHYRSAPESGTEVGEAVRRLVATRPDISVMPGHCIFEVKRPTSSKATAVAGFMQREPFAGRRPFFIGDDVTDEAGFAEVRKRGGTAYSVGREMTGVDGWFRDTGEVRAWLEKVASLAPASV